MRVQVLPIRLLHVPNRSFSYLVANRLPASRGQSITAGRCLSTTVDDSSKSATVNELCTRSGWSLGPQNGFLSKTLQFQSFTDAWSFMSALALFSARHNHHPNILQVYNRVHVQLHTHSQPGSDKISELDIKMAKFIDRRISTAVLLDNSNLSAPASEALEQLMSLSPVASTTSKL